MSPVSEGVWAVQKVMEGIDILRKRAKQAGKPWDAKKVWEELETGIFWVKRCTGIDPTDEEIDEAFALYNDKHGL